MSEWKNFSVVEFRDGVKSTVFESDSLDTARAEARDRSNSERRFVVLHNGPFAAYQNN